MTSFESFDSDDLSLSAEAGVFICLFLLLETELHKRSSSGSPGNQKYIFQVLILCPSGGLLFFAC